MEKLIIDINKFNFQYIKFETNASQTTPEIRDHILQKYLEELLISYDPELFIPDLYEVSNFYIHIHKLICKVDPNSDLMSSSITLLKSVIQSKEIRIFLIEKLRFLPALCVTLENFHKNAVANNKLELLLLLLEDITYNITINHVEPYVVDLIKILIDHINQEDPLLAKLSLSILVNICFKNVTIIYLLVRSVHLPSFAKKITSFGVLSKKMILILEKVNADCIEINDLRNFFTAIFGDINTAIKTWNVQYLRHTIDFITYAQTNDSTEYTMEIFDFQNIIIDLIETINKMDIDMTNKNVLSCISMVFELIDNIILSKNKSLENIYTDINLFTLKWINNKLTSSKAIDTIRLIIDTSIITMDTSIITDGLKCELVKILKNINLNRIDNAEVIISLLKLLVVLNKYKIDIISDEIDFNFYRQILQPIIDTQQCQMKLYNINKDLVIYLNCLYTIMNYENYREEFKQLLNMKPIQYMLAWAMKNDDEDNILEITFLNLQLSRSIHFPIKEISQIRSSLNNKNIDSNEPKSNDTNYINIQQQQQQFKVNKTVEDRLNQLINRISNTFENKNFNNIQTSELIELYNYKLTNYERAERDNMEQLENGTKEITNLRHRIVILNDENRKHQHIYYSMNANQERMKEKSNIMENTLKGLTASIGQITARSEMFEKKCVTQEKNIEIQNAEIIAQKQNLEVSNKNIIKLGKELKDLKRFKTEAVRSLEVLSSAKEKLELDIDNLQRENVNYLNSINNMKEVLSKKEQFIIHLEASTIEKNEKIEQLENELKEQATMQNSIMSLIQGKRKK